jgi:hypothetical protein
MHRNLLPPEWLLRPPGSGTFLGKAQVSRKIPGGAA